MPTTRYQEGSIERIKRAKGPAVWVYRWRETIDGKCKHRARTIGTVKEYPTKADAKKANDNFRVEVNASREHAGKITVTDAWGDFQVKELRAPAADRSPSTIQGYLDYFKNWIIPEWGHIAIEDVDAVAVEEWLRDIKRAPGTKAKIRNLMSSLFSHCIRRKLYKQINPIQSVRQGAGRLREPDVLTVEEMKRLFVHIRPPAIRVMVLTAASSALRRSELRGLKWEDLELDKLWFNLRRGLVREGETKMKTEASRRGIPMTEDLAEVFRVWRSETPYPADTDWVFASPYTNGKRPYWADAALADHIQPAALKAGIQKRIGWHTFRHSLATLLGQQRENIKVVQELLRHSNSRITQELYQHAAQDDKRNALSHMSGIFVVPAKKLGDTHLQHQQKMAPKTGAIFI